MSTIKNLITYFCRRRAITSRLLPVILQLLLVVLIWWILKYHMSIAVEKKDLSGRDSLSFSDQSQILPVVFSRTKALHFLDLSSILSQSNALEHSGKLSRTRYLRVDIYVHDVDEGTLFLYPVGTPVNFEEGNTNEGNENMDDVNDEYADDNVASEDDLLNAYVNYDANEGNDHDNYKLRKQVYRNDSSKELLVKNVNGFAQIMKDDNQQSLDDPINNDYEENIAIENQNSGVVDKMLFQNQMLMTRSVEQEAFQPGFGQTPLYEHDSQQNQVADEDLNQQSLELGQNIGDLKINLNGIASRPDSHQNSMTLNQNLNQQLSPDDGQQVREALRFGAQVQSLPQIVLQNQDNGLNFEIPFISSDVKQLESSDSNIKNMIQLNKNIDPILTDGFLDRANTLISELHGNFVNNIDFKDGNSSNLLLMNNPQICQSLAEIDLVYLINSKPQSYDMRRRIRETFVNKTYFKPSVIVHIFLVGKTTSPKFQQSFHQEQELYGDIIQGNFLDVPENATEKGLMGMQWVTQFCHQAKYIMSINEDVFVDTDKLINGLILAAKKIANRRIMLCIFNPESPIPRSGPSAVNEHLFPGRINLRAYCKGLAILMTGGVISSLLAASAHMMPIHMDELYLYGFLPFIAGGIDVFDVYKRAFNSFGMETVKCYQQKLDACPLVATVAFSERFTTLWDYVKTRIQAPHQDWKDERSLWNVESFIKKF